MLASVRKRTLLSMRFWVQFPGRVLILGFISIGYFSVTVTESGLDPFDGKRLALFALQRNVGVLLDTIPLEDYYRLDFMLCGSKLEHDLFASHSRSRSHINLKHVVCPKGSSGKHPEACPSELRDVACGGRVGVVPD